MIYNKNDISALSKNLIDSVRKVMEAKEGGHPKTEKQKDLAAKAPPHDKITHADVLVGRGVLKKHPTTGKLVAKEEAEGLSEAKVDVEGDGDEGASVMKGVLKKHGITVKNHGPIGDADKYTFHKGGKKIGEHHVDWQDSAEDVVRGFHGVVKKHLNNPLRIRSSGDYIHIKEEAEQIDELSTQTLQSYRKKARAQGNAIVDKMKMGGGDWSKDQKDTKTLRKRAAGAQASGKQLVKRGESLKTEEVEQIDELSPMTKDAYAQKAGKQLSDLFKKSGKDADSARKYYNRKNTVRKIANEEVEQIDEALGAADRFKHHHDNAKNLLKSIGEHLKTEHAKAHAHMDYKGRKGPDWGHVGNMENIAQQLGYIHDQLARTGEFKEEVEVEEVALTEEEIAVLNELDANYDEIVEEVEEIEELSKNTLHSYIEKSAQDVHNQAYRAGKKEGSEGKYDSDKILKSLTRQIGISKATRKLAGKAKVNVGEEVEIDEARGRPPKEGSAAWKRRQEAEKKGETEGDEPRQHIIQQLQRAKLSMQGGSKVKFKNGEEHDIRGSHAAKLLDKYAGMKPSEKEDFQKKIAASHSALKGEL